MEKTFYAIALSLVLFLSSCDMDIVPKGQSTLENATDLEMLLNNKALGESAYKTCGVLVNEGYSGGSTPLSERIWEKSLLGIHLRYDESANREEVASTDTKYNNIYKYVNYMNVIIGKVDAAAGDEQLKKSIKAEAQVTRAYLLFLAANMYAKQYDENTVENEGGIAYPEDYDVGQKVQLPLKECYEKMLNDCSDDNIEMLKDNANVVRISKAGGYAVRAVVLFQMKRYEEALGYALKSIGLNDHIEDRSSILKNSTWTLLQTSPNNLFYISSVDASGNPVNEQISPETVSLFEKGDYVKDYARSRNEWYWSQNKGELASGIKGCCKAMGYDAFYNMWGLTVEQIMYLAAECYIRTGSIQKGLDLVNRVRSYRIHPDYYKAFTASTEEEAMTLLQRAKFIECIGSFWNFIDRKRWNTETKYKKTVVRDLQDNGKFSISPDSRLWVLPFPSSVMQNNSSFKQNY